MPKDDLVVGGGGRGAGVFQFLKGEMTKRGPLLHGEPYGVPKMEYP